MVVRREAEVACAIVTDVNCSFHIRQLQIGEAGTILEARQIGLSMGDYIGVILNFLRDDPRFSIRTPTLWDFRGFDFKSQPPAAFRSGIFSLPRYPERRGVKRGYLVDTDTGFGMLRMYQGAASGFGMEDQQNMKVSYDRDELIDWLIT